MSKSKIEWTDETWNPVTGCTKVSSGCKHCYAERIWPRLAGNPKHVAHGRKFTDVQCHPERVNQPLHWQRPRMVFVNSMSDLFHKDVPDEFIRHVFCTMALARKHTFQVLTKRPERMLAFCKSSYAKLSMGRKFLDNVWLGVSVEDQATADERIPLLLQAPAAVRFVSAEPLLGPVDLNAIECLIDKRRFECTLGNYLDWVICGGESGPKARPMHPDWARVLRDQCAGAGVPFFFKQWGEWCDAKNYMVHADTKADEIDHLMRSETYKFYPPDNEMILHKVGKKAAGCLLDGVEHKEMPL